MAYNPHWLSARTEAAIVKMSGLLVVGEGIPLTGKGMNLELKLRRSLTAPCRSMRRKAMLSCLSLLIYDLHMITTTSVEKELTVGHKQRRVLPKDNQMGINSHGKIQAVLAACINASKARLRL